MRGSLDSRVVGPKRPWRFLVSTTGCVGDIRRHMGSADYSYGFVLKALTPVLERLGSWELVEQPESCLSYRAARARERGLEPVHLVLHPPHNASFTPDVPTILFPFWEFPNLPDQDFRNDTRQNWVRMCRAVDLILTACRFTAEAFQRAEVDCPIEIVPVPLAPEPFEVPPWNPEDSWTIECRHLVLGGDEEPGLVVQDVSDGDGHRVPLAAWKRFLRGAYRRYIRRWLNDQAIERVKRVRKRILHLPEVPPPLLPSRPLTISGLVYTSLFNLSDRRKNAADLLSAFLIAFNDRPDVTLVLKLATSPSREYYDLLELQSLYQGFGLRHRCRVVVITDYLTDEQMMSLFRVSTYYLNTSRAEGACLPLQQAMAAGRPAIAPDHTAMSDYIDEAVGFVVPSHPEPTFWPHDPARRLNTTWNRLVWSDLRDRLIASASVADTDRGRYEWLSSNARQRMFERASRDVSEAALRQALEKLRNPANRFVA